MALTARRRRFAYASGGFGLAINAMIQFLLPLRASELGVGIGVIGLMLGAKALTEAVFSVPLGGFMDRVGPRRAFIIGTGASAVIALGYTVATSAFAIFALQVLLGMVRPLGWVGAQSYVAGLRTGDERAHDTGKFSFSATVAQIIAPLLVGTAAQSMGTGRAFVVVSLYAALFFLLGFVLPDAGRTQPSSGQRETFRNAAGLLRLRGMQVAMLLTFARLWVPSTWTSFFPLHLVSSGMSESVAGTVVSAMAITATITAAFTGRISRLGRPQPLAAAALGIAATGVALSPFIDTIPLVYVASGMVGIGQGLSLPLLIVIVSDGAPAEQRGLALGLRSSVNQVSAALAPATVAPIIAAAGLVIGFPIAGAIAGCFLAAAMVLDRRDDR